MTDLFNISLDLTEPATKDKETGMNTELVTLIDGNAVTTSLIIAEGTQNEHASVIKLVRTYLADLEKFGRVGFEIQPFETPGGVQKREVALLNEQQATLLLTLMRNSEIVVRFKVALVKAFFDLMTQQKTAPVLPLNDPAFLRSTLLTYTEKVIALEAKVQEQAPKVAALERISAGEKSLTLTQAAKLLGRKRDDVARRMHILGWIYRQNGSWVAHSAAIRAGRLEYKEAHFTNEDGFEAAKPYCHITPKGLTELAARMEIHLAA
jgi:phage antirepressor YoqD-like protein